MPFMATLAPYSESYAFTVTSRHLRCPLCLRATTHAFTATFMPSWQPSLLTAGFVPLYNMMTLVPFTESCDILL